jgi:hypothetical protein
MSEKSTNGSWLPIVMLLGGGFIVIQMLDAFKVGYKDTGSSGTSRPYYTAPNASNSSKVSPLHQQVGGHYRDGKWVDPYHRTVGDNTQKNNFNSKPNTNPYTNKPGSAIPRY